MLKTMKMRQKLKKKGQGMGLKMVIIAALLLVVMVFMFLLLGKSQELAVTGTMCEPDHGDCKPREQCDFKLSGFTCPGENVCCDD